nr:hypothetical protein BgiMline_025936 [Biomphalaria glabrata]
MHLGFTSSLAFLVNTVTIICGHLCLTDPPQRLKTGNKTMVDCFQNSNPPCGKDFPFTPSDNPVTLRPGSEYAVHLHMPTRHFNPNVQGSYVINIQLAGSQEFMALGKWPDGPEEYKILTVKIPKQSGQHLLQAIYQPAGRAYYSCADVQVLDEVTADSNQPAPFSAMGNSATTTTIQRPIIPLVTLLLSYNSFVCWI